MGRPREFKNPIDLGVRVESEELDALEDIRWREHKERAEIIRIAIQEYIRNHAEGNNTFRLDKWNEDPTFTAIPTLLSKSETWYKYLQECSKEERLRIQIQANQINKQCIGINSND